MTTLLAPRVGGEDWPMHPTRRPVPTMRQLLRHRWQWLADELEPAGDLPALVQAMRGLLGVTGDWGVTPLPVYPPWRRTAASATALSAGYAWPGYAGR